MRCQEGESGGTLVFSGSRVQTLYLIREKAEKMQIKLQIEHQNKHTVLQSGSEKRKSPFKCAANK